MHKKISPKVIVLFVLFFIVSIIYIVSITSFDNKVNDFLTKTIISITNQKTDDKVVLVVVDDVSTDKLQWPWTRDKFATIFNYLEKDCGAKAVVFQHLVLFPDSYEPQKDVEFYNSIQHNNKLINSYVLLNSYVAGDVLPLEYVKLFLTKNNVNIIDKRTKFSNHVYKGVVNLPKAFLEKVNFLGSSILSEDKDGVLRSYMPVVAFNDKLLPSIALSAYAMATGNNTFVLYDDYLCSIDDCKTVKMPIVKKVTKDNFDNRIEGIYSSIYWFKPINSTYTHKHYSAFDVLLSSHVYKSGGQPKLPPELFKDKVVIVGLNADKDVWVQNSQTPILLRQADIDVHATYIDNLMANTFKINAAHYSTLIVTVIFCLFVIFGFRNFRLSFLFATLLSILYFIYYYVQFTKRVYIPPITPVVTIYSCVILKNLFHLITSDNSTERIKKAMGKFVSKDVMKTLLKDIDKIHLGGVRTVVTVLFVDIRDFTKISENMEPHEVTSILNEYFSLIEPIIGKYNGIINKYMGDGALAIFGEPIKDENHALSAIKCGIELTEKVKILREKLLKEGKPKIEIGIGINTGEVFAGNIGTEERLEYTVIGDNVNLASRIESYNQLLKTNFLISQYTYDYVKDFVEVVKLSQVEIKGKSRPIDIYEILKIKNEQ